MYVFKNFLYPSTIYFTERGTTNTRIPIVPNPYTNPYTNPYSNPNRSPDSKPNPNQNMGPDGRIYVKKMRTEGDWRHIQMTKAYTNYTLAIFVGEGGRGLGVGSAVDLWFNVQTQKTDECGG